MVLHIKGSSLFLLVVPSSKHAKDLHFLWESCNQKLDSLCRFAYWTWHTFPGNLAMAFPRTRCCKTGYRWDKNGWDLYVLVVPEIKTGWWFQKIFYFHPHLGKISNLTNIFQMGWNHQLVKGLMAHEPLVGEIPPPGSLRWLLGPRGENGISCGEKSSSQHPNNFARAAQTGLIFRGIVGATPKRPNDAQGVGIKRMIVSCQATLVFNSSVKPLNAAQS